MQAPAIAQTTEQKIRGNDQFADWVVIVVRYDLGVLDELTRKEMHVASLVRMGAQSEVVSGLYALSFSALACEFHVHTLVEKCYRESGMVLHIESD